MPFSQNQQGSGQLHTDTWDDSKKERDDQFVTRTWKLLASPEAQIDPQVNLPTLSQELKDSSSFFGNSTNLHRMTGIQLSDTASSSIEPAGPQLPLMQERVEDGIGKFDFENTIRWPEDDNFMGNFMTYDEGDVEEQNDVEFQYLV